MVLILTIEQHEDYEHLCGRREREIQDLDCRDCLQKMECMLSHTLQEYSPRDIPLGEYLTVYENFVRQAYQR